MVMKTAFKTAYRMFSKQIARLLTIVAIVIVSVGFMSGIGESENKINQALVNYYNSQNISDLLIKSQNSTGFTKEEIESIEDKFGKENVMKSFSYDATINETITRLYTFDISKMNINKLELLEGNYPSSSNEIVVERKTNKIKSYNINDKITINDIEYTVSGIVLNPLIIQKNEEISYIENEHLENVIYFDSEFLPITNDLYITIENRDLFNAFSSKYETKINELKSEITLENVTILSLYENYGLYSLSSYAQKVGMIGIIFVVFFLAVTILVVFSTMTRLLDEERSQIACLKTLGYSNFKIISKYLLFVSISTILGCILAFGVGTSLTRILYIAFGIQYSMPPFPSLAKHSYYILTSIIIFIATLLVTLFSGLNLSKNKPSTLLTPKAPKIGRKVILEKIPFIWNKLSFKYKSSIRNVLLFRSRFFMTIISIIGSTVLVLAGMGLFDCTMKSDYGTSLITISIALIIFSALLCALVIYNITNINVSERNREIATLMVLGYQNNEVCGYIFREIYIMSFIASLLGLPLGFVFIDFVFDLINFGNVADINWYTWVLAPIITMLFSGVATLLLRKKITKTDMNASLKTLE